MSDGRGLPQAFRGGLLDAEWFTLALRDACFWVAFLRIWKESKGEAGDELLQKLAALVVSYKAGDTLPGSGDK